MTIELESLRGDHTARRPAQTGFLRRNVPRRTLECPHAAAQDRPPAFRTHGGGRKAGDPDQTVHRCSAGRRSADPRHGVPRPDFLDFLGLSGHHVEKDVEDAILRELEAFILELGAGFTFVARQKRITVDNEDYYLDLLFYHRHLRSLVAVDLKLGKFQAADKGQMELYLRWLEQHDTQPGEERPLGLILCADKSNQDEPQKTG